MKHRAITCSIFSLLFFSNIGADDKTKDVEKAKVEQSDQDIIPMDKNEKNLIHLMDDSLKNEIVLDALKSHMYDSAFQDAEKTDSEEQVHQENADADSQSIQHNSLEEVGESDQKGHQHHHHGDNEKRGIPVEISQLLASGGLSPTIPSPSDELDDEDEYDIDQELAEDEEFVEKKLKRITKEDPLWFTGRRRTDRRRTWFGRRRANGRRRFAKRVNKVGSTIGNGIGKAGKSIGSWYRRIRLTKKDTSPIRKRKRESLDKD